MSKVRVGVLLLTLALAGTAAERKTALGNAPEDKGAAPLLTPGLGIVINADRNKDLRSGIPFLPTPGEHYFYWQCLRLDKVRFGCTGAKRAESGTGCRRDNCIPELEVHSEGAAYLFIAHQVWCVENYRDLRAEIRRVLRHERVACFGGEYIGEDPPQENNGKRSSAWFLKRIKTAHGKWDYFPE